MAPYELAPAARQRWHSQIQRARKASGPGGGPTQKDIAAALGTDNSEVSRFEKGDPDVLRRWFTGAPGASRAAAYAKAIGRPLSDLQSWLRTADIARDAAWHIAFPTVNADAVFIEPPIVRGTRDGGRPTTWNELLAELHSTRVADRQPLRLGGARRSGWSWAERWLTLAVDGLEVEHIGPDDEGFHLLPWAAAELRALGDKLRARDPRVRSAQAALDRAAEEVEAIGLRLGPDLCIRLVAAIAEGPADHSIEDLLAHVLARAMDHPALRTLDEGFLGAMWARLRLHGVGRTWGVAARASVVELVDAVAATDGRDLVLSVADLDRLLRLSDGDRESELAALLEERRPGNSEAVVDALVATGHMVVFDGGWLGPADEAAATLLAARHLSGQSHRLIDEQRHRWVLDASWWPLLRLAVKGTSAVEDWRRMWEGVAPDLAGPAALALVHVLLGAGPGADEAPTRIIEEVQALAVLTLASLNPDAAAVLGLGERAPVAQALMTLSERFRHRLPPVGPDIGAELRARVPARIRPETPTTAPRWVGDLVPWQVLDPGNRGASQPSWLCRLHDGPAANDVLTWHAERGHPTALAIVSGQSTGGRAWTALPDHTKVAWLGWVSPTENIAESLPGLVSRVVCDEDLAEKLAERLRALPPSMVRPALVASNPTRNLSEPHATWLLARAVELRDLEFVNSLAEVQVRDGDRPGIVDALLDQAPRHIQADHQHLEDAGLRDVVTGHVRRLAWTVRVDAARCALGAPDPLDALAASLVEPSKAPRGRLRCALAARPARPISLMVLLQSLPTEDVLAAALETCRAQLRLDFEANGASAVEAERLVASRLPSPTEHGHLVWSRSPQWLRGDLSSWSGIDELAETGIGSRMLIAVVLLGYAETRALPLAAPEAARRWLDRLLDVEHHAHALDAVHRWARHQMVVTACLENGRVEALPDDVSTRGIAEAWVASSDQHLKATWSHRRLPHWLRDVVLRVALAKAEPPRWAKRAKERRDEQHHQSLVRALASEEPSRSAVIVLRETQHGTLPRTADTAAVLQRWWPDPRVIPKLARGFSAEIPGVDALVGELSAPNSDHSDRIRALFSWMWTLPILPEVGPDEELLRAWRAAVSPPPELRQITRLAARTLAPGELSELLFAAGPTPAGVDRAELTGLHPFLAPEERSGPIDVGTLRAVWLWDLLPDLDQRFPEQIARFDARLFRVAGQRWRFLRNRETDQDVRNANSLLARWRATDGKPDDPTLYLWGPWAARRPAEAWAWLQSVRGDRQEDADIIGETLFHQLGLVRGQAPEAGLWAWACRQRDDG